VARDESRPRGRWIEQVRERKERHKQRSRLYRIVVGIAAVLVILLGLVLSVPGVPGPGLLLLLVGLGLLALEFDRAERLLERILDRVEGVADKALDAPLWQQIVGGAVTVAAIVAGVLVFVLWDVPILPG
jgi:hypothetical protein